MISAIPGIIVFLVLTGFLFFQFSPTGQTCYEVASYTLREWAWRTEQVPLVPPSDLGLELGAADDEYLLGVGKADITGPVVEINLMGYADPKQLGSGLRQRLYSRAFIFGSPTDPKERIIYLVLDTQSGDTAVSYGILEGLKGLGPEFSVYGRQNVAVTGTHSHSGPGAWLNYLLPQITSKGFNKESYQAIVDGALLSIKRAHESLRPGYIRFGETELLNANINRSPYAYLANPQEERDRYEHNVDKNMTLLLLLGKEDGRAMGVLNWFPVHGTSMLGNNTLITGDNKGVAAHLLEKEMNSGKVTDPEVVTGFSQANVGDTSPNVNGAYCEDGSGEQCDFETSLCNGRNEPCHGRGPFWGLNDAGTKSCFEIGHRQYQAASSLLVDMLQEQSAWPKLKGPIRSFHAYRDMSNLSFVHSNGSVLSTCPAALGYSFAAGTTDGPGAFDFKQNNSGDPNASPVWSVVSKFIHDPSEEQIKCHKPKPILLDVGEATSPYLWTPNVVDIQVMRVGQLFIIVSSGEATTMSGRRWKAAVAKAAEEGGIADGEALVVLGGPGNTYSHYIATEEEYGVQRYEGASTLYGPNTLNAYINLTTTLLPFLAESTPPQGFFDPGPDPPIHINNSLSFITPVIYDRSGFVHDFGDVLEDVRKPTEKPYHIGESVHARFVAACPRNNLRLEDTYALVERENPQNGIFERIATDADWDLTFEWLRTSEVLATSEVTLTWTVPTNARPGLYRMKYFGESKSFGSGKISSFNGTSGVFGVES